MWRSSDVGEQLQHADRGFGASLLSFRFVQEYKWLFIHCDVFRPVMAAIVRQCGTVRMVLLCQIMGHCSVCR